MVNENLVRLIIGTATAAISGVATWHFTKTRYEKYVQEQIADVKEFYGAVIVELPSVEPAVTTEDPTPIEDPPEVEDEEYKKHLEIYGRDIVSHNPYNKIYERPEGEPVYLISKDEYYSDETRQEKESLTYYAGDEVITSFGGDVMRETLSVVGDEFQDHFIVDGRTRSVWIRNERMGIDYEIDLDDGSYSEVVLGLLPEKESILKFRDDD